MPTLAQPRRPSADTCVVARSAAAAVIPYSWELMLLDNAAERISRARDAMGNSPNRNGGCDKHRSLSTAVQIIGELRSTLDVRGGDPLAANMSDLCDYICRQLVAAKLRNRVATLDEVSHLLREARIAWVMLPPEARATQAAARKE
jgi:flagellar secretion chaperone FliS